MLVRAFLTGVGFAMASAAATASTSISLDVPTASPYTRIDGHAARGSFTDTVSFTLDSLHEGYVWLFPRQDWLFSVLDNIQSAGLSLRNESTGQTWSGLNYAQSQGAASYLAANTLSLSLAGLDPNKSLFLSGSFGAGQYTAFISGTATGLNGGTYVAKFSVTPAIPEPTSAALMLLGLGGMAAVLARRRG